MTADSESILDVAAPPPQLPPGTRRKNLFWRLISAAALVSLVLGTLLWGSLELYAAVCSVFMLLGLLEFFNIIRHRGILVNRLLGMGLGVLFCLLVVWRSLIEPGLIAHPFDGRTAALLSWMWDVFWPFAIITLCIRQISRGNTFEALSGMASTLFGLAYVCALFSYFFYLRAIEPAQGAELVLYLILVTKMGDVGAYAVGNLLGRHAFVPRISPRKTIEGFVGAILMSGATAVFAQPLLGRPMPPVPSLMLGMFLGLFGELGDLAESLIKRDCQVKDAGQLLPGMGGVLDVMDSLLFTAPLFYAVLIFG